MNDAQHEAMNKVHYAQGRVNALINQLNQARQHLKDCKDNLDTTIRRDPGSYYGTPAVEVPDAQEVNG